jgi:hypothetical protein
VFVMRFLPCTEEYLSKSQMMMEATMEKLELAFERGTHVNRQDYATVSKLKACFVL